MLCMADTADQITFVDPDKPPPGLDLSRLPAGVDVNDLIARELVSAGELADLADEGDPSTKGDAPTFADQQDTVAVIQEIVDAHCFDPSDAED